jgi:hypothetical protein
MSDRRNVVITNHAIERWRQRVANVSGRDAVAAIRAALATANDRHFKPNLLKKPTFFIPTEAVMFIGSRGKIVTVVSRSDGFCSNGTVSC